MTAGESLCPSLMSVILGQRSARVAIGMAMLFQTRACLVKHCSPTNATPGCLGKIKNTVNFVKLSALMFSRPRIIFNCWGSSELLVVCAFRDCSSICLPCLSVGLYRFLRYLLVKSAQVCYHLHEAQSCSCWLCLVATGSCRRN